MGASISFNSGIACGGIMRVTAIKYNIDLLWKTQVGPGKVLFNLAQARQYPFLAFDLILRSDNARPRRSRHGKPGQECPPGWERQAGAGGRESAAGGRHAPETENERPGGGGRLGMNIDSFRTRLV